MENEKIDGESGGRNEERERGGGWWWSVKRKKQTQTKIESEWTSLLNEEVENNARISSNGIFVENHLVYDFYYPYNI